MKGWCDNPSGSRPNSFGRRHLTFDKGGKFSAEQGIVRFCKGWCGARVANDKNIKKRSQHITVTAFIDYCFV